MTEYDYSPEAYERYMATQHRIANWVDQTEHYRPQFEPAAPGAPPGSVSLPQQHQSSSRHHTQRAHRPPPMDLHRPYDRPSPPSSSSSSSFIYPAGSPGPTPYAGPSPIYAQQPIYQPLAPPLISPIYSAPLPQKRAHHSKSHRSRRSHSHYSPSYDYVVATPPAPSPAYAYGYPNVPVMPPNIRASSPGYIVLPQARYPPNPNAITTTSPADTSTSSFSSPHPSTTATPSSTSSIQVTQSLGQAGQALSSFNAPAPAGVYPSAYFTAGSSLTSRQILSAPRLPTGTYVHPKVVHRKVYNKGHK